MCWCKIRRKVINSNKIARASGICHNRSTQCWIMHEDARAAFPHSVLWIFPHVHVKYVHVWLEFIIIKVWIINSLRLSYTTRRDNHDDAKWSFRRARLVKSCDCKLVYCQYCLSSLTRDRVWLQTSIEKNNNNYKKEFKGGIIACTQRAGILV